MANNAKLKVVACKRASSTSEIQKMADIGRQFAIFKAACKTTTAINSPSGFGLKREIEFELDHLHTSGILLLKLPEKNP